VGRAVVRAELELPGPESMGRSYKTFLLLTISMWITLQI